MSRPASSRSARLWFSSTLLALGLTAQDAPVPAGALELRQLGPQLSMDWVAEARLRSPADLQAAAKAALRLPLTTPVLQDAALRFAAVTPFYRQGILLYQGRPATVADLPALARAFVAGLTDDEQAKADTMALMLRELVVTGARIRAGSELIEIAVREHAAVWASLGDLVADAAGPVAESSPLTVAVVVGDATVSGLQFRNGGDSTLHNVVLAVDSTLATEAQGNIVTHTVFVPEWTPERLVLLPPRLMLAAARGAGGSVSYRLWADELRVEHEVSLPARTAATPATRRGESTVLPLGDGAAATAPTAARGDDALLGAPTALLERGEWKQAEVAFEQIEAKLARAPQAADPDARGTLAVVRYRLAEALRLRGFAAARASADDEAAKNLLLRTKRKYAEVLEVQDVATDREGASLHAAALRQMVHVDAILCQGYRLLLRQRPKEKALRRRAEAHEASAERSLRVLEEKYGTVRGVDGRTHAESARAAVREVVQAR